MNAKVVDTLRPGLNDLSYLSSPNSVIVCRKLTELIEKDSLYCHEHCFYDIVMVCSEGEAKLAMPAE